MNGARFLQTTRPTQPVGSPQGSLADLPDEESGAAGQRGENPRILKAELARRGKK